MGDATDWMDGDAPEPVWPKDHKPAPPPVPPKLRVCDGCGKARPWAAFDGVDAQVAGRYAFLVRCDECRQVKPLATPFDDKGK